MENNHGKKNKDSSLASIETAIRLLVYKVKSLIVHIAPFRPIHQSKGPLFGSIYDIYFRRPALLILKGSFDANICINFDEERDP